LHVITDKPGNISSDLKEVYLLTDKVYWK